MGHSVSFQLSDGTPVARPLSSLSFLASSLMAGIPEARLLCREGLVSRLPVSHGAQGQRGSLAAVIVVFTALATSSCCWHCGLESLARHLLGLGGPPLCGMSWSAAKPEQWLFLFRSKGLLICFSKLERGWLLLIDYSKTVLRCQKLMFSVS